MKIAILLVGMLIFMLMVVGCSSSQTTPIPKQPQPSQGQESVGGGCALSPTEDYKIAEIPAFGTQL